MLLYNFLVIKIWYKYLQQVNIIFMYKCRARTIIIKGEVFPHLSPKRIALYSFRYVLIVF